MAEFTQHLATPPLTFRFLELPVEIRTEVVNHFSRPSHIKALCRVSKEVSDIATPRLYNRVDLTWMGGGRNNSKEQEDTLLARISSLLSAPSNLQFIRILNIGCFGPQTTKAIDALLPQLKENGLIEFNFWDNPDNFFPTPEQICLLWSRQKNLQNIQLCTHHIQSLVDFFGQTQELRKSLPKSFTRLGLANFHELASDVLLLPLKIVDVSCLRSLTLSGAIPSKVVYQLNHLFASRSFFRLTVLHVEAAVFQETLELSNLPSLIHLSFGLRRGSYPYIFENKGLVVPPNFPLRLLVWAGLDPLHHPTLERVLTQVKGLEHLEIESVYRITIARNALAEAIEMHKSTLKTLLLDESIETEPSAYDELFLGRILRCEKLEILTLPLPPNKPVSYYTNIIASLPCLIRFRIYDCAGAHMNGTEPRSVELVKALQKFPRIEIFEFSKSTHPNEGRPRSHCLVYKY